MKEIEEIRSYCLNCKNSQCRIKGCPLDNCIPEFIHETDSKKAYEILCNTTVLPAICGRICPHEKQCEGSCIRGIKGEPVSIGAMEAYIGDLSIENNYELSIEVDERAKDKRVAVIGSGPAGLTCAAFLARRGVKVTIYEKHDKLGGLLTHGIPDFRLPREVVEKTIEKIPYLGLQKISRKKSVKYIGVTAVKIIGHKKHLLLEVYENKKESKKIPVVRIALTKKDFGTYWPDKHVWTRQQVSYYRPIWMETHTGGTLTDENILQSPEDLERIKTFCGTKLFNPSWWWEHISRYEADITSTERINRVEREHKRRQEALKDRQANTKALPEKAILYRADHVYFHDEHFLYYKKHGSRADIACSKCGGVTTARWKSSGAYEDQFERNIEEPRENSFGTCPMCGARGQYKCKGKVKGSIRKNRYLFLGQKYKDNGFVMRYIQVEKEWTLGFIAGDNGNEMYNAYEKLSGVELARAYFEPGKKAQVDYNKHDPYVGRDFWDDCNLYGLSSIRINSGPILPETYDEMAGTMFQYSAMKEYTDSLMSVCNPVEYLECYMRTPQLEMLVKMHLIGVAEKLIKCQYGIIEDETATRPDEFLGIRKEKLKLLIKEKGDIGLLRVLQMEKRLAENWTDEQVQQLAETGLTYTQVVLAEKYMTLQKFLNRIKKYACCDYGGCSQSVYRIRHMASTYADYLSMREDRGYDLTNTVYQFPHDLDEAHEKMVEEVNKEKLDKHLKDVAARFPNIRHSYRKLRNKYYYEDDTYIIRPAKSAEEIVTEGRVLHHCVGGDNYLGKHNRGETYILFLRFKDTPNMQYVTVEIEATTPNILQWYGAHDKKPDQENIQKWLNSYIRMLVAGTLRTAGMPAMAIAYSA